MKYSGKTLRTAISSAIKAGGQTFYTKQDLRFHNQNDLLFEARLADKEQREPRTPIGYYIADVSDMVFNTVFVKLNDAELVLSVDSIDTITILVSGVGPESSVSIRIRTTANTSLHTTNVSQSTAEYAIFAAEAILPLYDPVENAKTIKQLGEVVSMLKSL